MSGVSSDHRFFASYRQSRAVTLESKEERSFPSQSSSNSSRTQKSNLALSFPLP